MPEAGFPFRYFSVTGQGGFDEGVVRGDIGGGVRLDYEARAAICHGISLEASVELAAALEGVLDLFWFLRAEGEGQVSALDGVKLDVRITPDVFDQVGLTLDAFASLEASAAGSLSIAFETADIEQLLRERVSGPAAYDVFLAMLRETSVGIGVWGKASVAISAEFSLIVRGSLANDETAGFVISQSMGAGCGGGAGYDWYVGAKFDNPKRFIVNAADIMTGEIVRQARTVLPRSAEPLLVTLEYILPASVACAYDLGQLATTDLIRGPEVASKAFVGGFLSALQRFLFDKLAWAAVTLLADHIQARAQHIEELELSAGDRAELRLAVKALMAALEAEDRPFKVFHEQIDEIAALVRAIDPDGESRWRPLLAAAWLAFAAADSLRHGIAPRHWSYEAVALFDTVARGESADSLQLPAPPDVVLAEISGLIGSDLSHLSLSVAMSYVGATRVVAWLADESPEMRQLMDVLTRATGLSARDLVDLGMRGGLDGRLEETVLYQSFRSAVAEALDTLLLDDLFTVLKEALPENADAAKWLKDAARPALVMLRHFVLDSLDQIVQERDLSAAFFDSFRTGLGIMVSRIVIDNVIVLADILGTHIITQVSGATNTLAADVRSNPQHVVAKAMEVLSKGLLPPWLPVPANLPEAARHLAADLLDASSLGLEVLNADFRREYLRLQESCLLSVAGVANNADPSALVDVVNNICACAFIPEPGALVNLTKLQAETTAKYFQVTLPPSIDAVTTFFRRVAEGELRAVEKAILAEVDRGRRTLIAIGQAVSLLLEEAAALLEDIEELSEQIAAKLRQAADWLKDSDRRSEVLDKLKEDGREKARDAAEHATRLLPAFDWWPAEVQATAVHEARLDARRLFDIAFAVAKPLIDEALKVVGGAIGDLAVPFREAANMADFLGDIARAVGERVDRAVRALVNLDLPDEIGIATIASAAAGLVSKGGFKNPIQDAFGFRATQGDYRQTRSTKRLAAARKKAEQKTLEARRATVRRARPAIIRIGSPHPVARSAGDVWTYGTTLPVSIGIENVVLLEPSKDGREALPGVFVAVNGTSVGLGQRPWRCAEGRATLSHTLMVNNSPLRPGLNVLECSYADGFHPTVRATVAFMVHGSPAEGNVFEPGAITDLTGWTVRFPDGARTELSGVFDADGPGSVTDGMRGRDSRRRDARGRQSDLHESSGVVIDARGRYRGELPGREER